MAGGLHPRTSSAMALTRTSQLLAAPWVLPPLYLFIFSAQTLPWEGQPRHTRPGLVTPELFDGLIWEDTFVSAFLPLAQLKGVWVQSKMDYFFFFFRLESILGKLILLGDVSWTQPVNFFSEKVVFRSSKEVFPYRYVPVETACLNCLTRGLQSSSQIQALLTVRTGISAITFAFLFRKEHPEGFFLVNFVELPVFLQGKFTC